MTPVRRSDDLTATVASAPTVPLLIAVGESDLPTVLAAIPPPQRADVILLQNELFPSDWELLTTQLTVAVVWLNRKQNRPAEVARPMAQGNRRTTCSFPALVPERILS